MMLLLGRLISLPLLLLRPRVKTLFSLRMLLKLPTPLSMGRFVVRDMLRLVWHRERNTRKYRMIVAARVKLHSVVG
ncbi:hypothetical protein ANAPH2_00381 [Anaplasma phagocytophilum]|nr:hypothetical protein ANAPH2_00381 [Anaplasma phagocytophilum]